MQVINNKTHYLTNISYEYLDGTKKTYDYDEITARGQTNALAEISSAISLFKLKECSISAKTDAIDITIYGIINKECGTMRLEDMKERKIYYSDDSMRLENLKNRNIISSCDGDFVLYDNSYPMWKFDYCLNNFSAAYFDLTAKGIISREVTWRVYDMDSGRFLYKLIQQDEYETRNAVKVKNNSGKKIEFVSIVTTSDKIIEIDHEQIRKLSARKIINAVMKPFNSRELHSLEIVSSEEGAVLTVRSENDKFSLGIIDEYNGSIYYYDNGGSDKDFIELSGETYPVFMISDNTDIFKTAITDFILNGTPSKRLTWRIEDF